MHTESRAKRRRSTELVDAVPLKPIGDEHSYTRALLVLDRLFALNREQSRAESEYFQALAEIVYEYESKDLKRPGESGSLNRVDHLDHGLKCECLHPEQCH